MNTYEVTIVYTETMDELSLTVTADEAETSDYIVLETAIGGRTIKASGESYLEAFQELRDKWLAFGYGMKCCGALINAVQSGMMSYTPQVYLVTLGQQAMKKDIAGIWDKCDISEFPDTAAQREFTEKWFNSLKK